LIHIKLSKLFNMGLTPLLQWVVVPGGAFAIIATRNRRACRLARVTWGPDFTLKPPCAMREE
jgi:hypothetical protein